jgi:DNA-binding GntR family transcriptional regulator
MISELQHVTKKEVVDEKDVDTLAKMLANVVEACAEEYSELCPSFERAAEQIQTQIAAHSNMRDVWRAIQDMWNVLSLGLRARENNYINEKQVQDWEHKYALALSAFKQRL